MKPSSRRLRYLAARGGTSLVGCILLAGAASGQDIPLPKVSEALPIVVRERLTIARTALLDREAAYASRSTSFNARCSRVTVDGPTYPECSAEFVTLSAEGTALIRDKKGFTGQLVAAVAGNLGCAPGGSGSSAVVTTCNVPSGLSRGVEIAIADAYSDAMPGVSERVRKGFQAVMDRDWPVAKAWFQDALNRDPDNPGLKRLVVLADAPVVARPAVQSLSEPPKKSEADAQFDTLLEIERERKRIDALFDMLRRLLPPSP